MPTLYDFLPKLETPTNGVLLDRFLESSRGQMGIHVGLEDAHPAMRELALIGVTVDLRKRHAGGRHLGLFEFLAGRR